MISRISWMRRFLKIRVTCISFDLCQGVWKICKNPLNISRKKVVIWSENQRRLELRNMSGLVGIKIGGQDSNSWASDRVKRGAPGVGLDGGSRAAFSCGGMLCRGALSKGGSSSSSSSNSWASWLGVSSTALKKIFYRYSVRRFSSKIRFVGPLSKYSKKSPFFKE